MSIFTKWVFILSFIASLVFLIRVILFYTGLIYTVKIWWRSIEDCVHVYQVFKVIDFDDRDRENKLYRVIDVYLTSISWIEDSDFANLFTGKKQKEVVLRWDQNQVIEDYFLGSRVYWSNQGVENGKRIFLLRIRKSDKRRILRPYLQHIHIVSGEIEERKTELKIYRNVKAGDRITRRWISADFTHPSTFETIVMETDLKNKIKSDLESFLKGKHYYNRLGRVWKRSFLLYGPSGTGKSSFVAAMANFLKYDVYDVNLSAITDDSDLKSILLQTTSKSVVVIEDLDRFLADKSAAVSVSAVMNFMDGILNSCLADERVMVFTMICKEQIDPTILRPGRVDVHIHFPLCDFSAFKTLASNYLGVTDHRLFSQVEEIFQNGSSLSPAEIGELMIANRHSPSRALKSVISALQTDGDKRGTRRKEASAVLKEERSKKLLGLLRIRSSNVKSRVSDSSCREQNEG